MSLMHKKLVTISLVLIGLSALAIMAVAKEGAEAMASMHGKAEFSGMQMAKELNLSHDQMQTIQTLELAAEKQNIQEQADMKILQVDLQAEGMKDLPDMDKLEKLTQKMGEAHAKMMLAHIRKMIAFRSVLTPEQKKALEQINFSMSAQSGEKREPLDMKGMGHACKDCDSK